MDRLLRAIREGEYSVPGKGRVYFQDGDTFKDAADLYAVLEEEAATGSPSVTNSLARAFLERLQSGQTLSGEQLAKLLQLLKSHKEEIAAFRADRSEDSDLLDVPNPDTARLLDGAPGGEQA